MQNRYKGRILTCGLSLDALLRVKDIRDDWPNRLSLTVLYEGKSVRVHTQLCGAHLVPNVLAAMAVGQAMGVGLQSAATALATVAPVPGRMCPIESPEGVTFICDDVKAPVWAIPPARDYVGRATAKRKIIILGTLSDYKGGAPSSTYARIARQAVEAADYAFFVNGFLRGFLQPGDFVFIRGSLADHLLRISLDPKSAGNACSSQPRSRSFGHANDRERGSYYSDRWRDGGQGGHPTRRGVRKPWQAVWPHASQRGLPDTGTARRIVTSDVV
jgi:hypothetical protein